MTFFTIYSILCEIIALVLILAIPSDAENQVFLGFSLNRLAFLTFIMVLMTISGCLLYMSLTRKWLFPKLFRFFEFSSKWVSFFIFAAAFLFSAILLLSFTNLLGNRFFTARLRPLFVLFALLFIGTSIYDVFAYHHKPWITFLNSLKVIGHQLIKVTETLYRWISKSFTGNRFLVYVMGLSFPLLFYVAITYSFPSGFAGLYTLMADQISQAGLSLPLSVPYYGPGGIPFAYPPAGFYLMAIITSIFQVSDFVYLRFAPAIFMWLSMIPLALITFEITKSKPAAIIAAVIVSGSQRVFYLQGTSGGMVRGLAFLFALLAIYFFILSAKQNGKLKYAVISGIFIGLTGLTHLSYLQFTILYIAAHFLVNIFTKRIWLATLVAGITSILAVTPWVILIVTRYGWQIFEGVFQSHGNDWFMLMLQDSRRIIPWSEYSLTPLFNMQYLWGMIVLGLVYSCLNKSRILAIWFGLLLLTTSEGDRYLFTVGAIIIGMIIGIVIHSLRDPQKESRIEWRPVILFSIILIIFYQSGWNAISSANQPAINQDSITLATYVQENTPSETTYLMIAAPAEAEWFPYLLHRVPVVASWGGEWIGTYNQHIQWINGLSKCQETQSIFCLDEILHQLPDYPDLLITKNDQTQLNTALVSQSIWEIDYQNLTYIIWHK